MPNIAFPLPPIVSPDQAPTAKTAAYPVVAADMFKLFTNTGAGADTPFTLPDPSTVGGCSLKFAVTTANTISVLPPSGGKIYLNGSGTADQKVVIAAVVGNFADVFSDGSSWLVINYSGVLTKV